MKIVVASQSAVKLDAVRQALADLSIEAELSGVKASSGVNEQPVGEETEQGARNRCAHARALDPSGDLYLAIENGIYRQADGSWVDKAVVLALTKDGRELLQFSDGVAFPAESVEEARERGFATTTVGQVMAERGIVEKHDDPHRSLTGISRATILTDTVRALLARQLKWTACDQVSSRNAASRPRQP